MAKKEKKTKRANGVEGQYKIYLGAFYKVNAKYRLIAEGKFTSSVHVINPGISYHPFLTARKIILADGVANTCKLSNFECRAADGNEIYVDLQWNEYVIDPIKLYKGSQNPGEELNGILSQGLKAFINTKNYEELSSYSFDLNSTEHEIVALKNKLVDFENRCGVRVDNITIPDVKLTETQKKANEAKVKAQADVAAMNVKIQAEKERKADIKEIQEAQGEALAAEINALVNSGMSLEDALNLKRMQIAANGRNPIFGPGVMPMYPINNGGYNSQNGVNDSVSQPYNPSSYPQYDYQLLPHRHRQQPYPQFFEGAENNFQPDTLEGSDSPKTPGL